MTLLRRYQRESRRSSLEAAFLFANALAELLNRHYPFVRRPKSHSSLSEHLHTHQTVIISIMFMRPLPRVRSKKHLGVIRCKSLPRRRKGLYRE